MVSSAIRMDVRENDFVCGKYRDRLVREQVDLDISRPSTSCCVCCMLKDLVWTLDAYSWQVEREQFCAGQSLIRHK
jgi:hypothetical protein